MAIFKKKRQESEELPDIPAMPELPELPDLGVKREFPMPEIGKLGEEGINFPKSSIPPAPKSRSLPSFPSSQFGDTISRQAVKHTVTETAPKFNQMISEGEPDMRSIPNFSPVQEEPEEEEQEEEEEEEKFPRRIETPVTLEMRNSQKAVFAPRSERSQGIQPVYVRIDKYEQAIKSFEDIKNKVVEIDELLRKIRDERVREEKELTDWESEIEMIKAKLEKIDSSVFRKLD